MFICVVLSVVCVGLSNKSVIGVCTIGDLILLFDVITLLFVILIITGVWVQYFGPLLLNGFLVFGLCLHTFASSHGLCLWLVWLLLFGLDSWTYVVWR